MNRPRKKYTKEFKKEAVALVTVHEYTIAEAARRLGVNEGMLGRWKQEHSQKKDEAFPGNGKQSGLENENRILRAELRRVQMERDILKKAGPRRRRPSLPRNLCEV